MANVKITELTALTNPASTDVLPIVDVVADVTKKVSIADLLENAGSGTAAAPGIAFDGDSDTGIYRPGADQVAISTNGTQALYIDSDGDILVADGNRMEIDEIRARDGAGLKLFDDGGAGIFIKDGGNVGLGTSSPTHMLDVNAGFASFKLTGVGADVTNQLFLGTGAGLYWVHNDRTTAGLQINTTGYFSGEYPITLKTESATTALFIDTSSRVGIGTTSPQAILNLDRTDLTTHDWLRVSQSGTEVFSISQPSNSEIRFATPNLTIDREFTWYIKGSEQVRLDTSGRLLVGTSSQSGGSLLQVNDDRIRIASSKTPASASDTGTAGEICWDSSYIYVCTATDTWKRAALSTW